MLRLLTLSVILAAVAAQNGYDYNRPNRPFSGTTPGRPGTTPGRPGSSAGRPGTNGAYPQGTATSPSEPGYNQEANPTGYPSGPNQGYLTPNRPSYPGSQNSGAQVTGPDGQTQGQGNFPGASTGVGSTGAGYPGQGTTAAGYPGQGTTAAGYPGQGTTAAGYPGQGANGAGYPGQQGTTGAAYPGQQGSSGAGYPGQQGTTGTGYPGQQGTTGAAYPGQQGSTGAGYPSQQGSTGSGYSGQQGSAGSGYSGQQGAPGAFPGQNPAGAGFPQGSNAGFSQGSGTFGQQSSQGQPDNFSDDSGAYPGGDYSAIPGEPDRDYPVLAEVPETSFRCDAQAYPGYYADVETRCQAFHVCSNNRTFDFLCPNGTIFSQQVFVCVWWNQFDCDSAPSLFGLNANLYDYSITGQNNQNAGQTGDFTQGSQYPTQGFGNAPSTKYPAGYQTGSQPSTGFAGSGPEYPGSQSGFPTSSFTGSTPGFSGTGPTPAYPTTQDGPGGRPATGYPAGRPAGPGFPAARPGAGAPQQPTREYLPPRI